MTITENKLESILEELGIPNLVHVVENLIDSNGEATISLLQRIHKTQSDLLGNGLFYTSLRNNGVDAFVDALDKYGDENASYIGDVVYYSKRVGVETVEEVIERFGIEEVERIAPVYKKHGELKIRKTLKKWPDISHFHIDDALNVIEEVLESEKQGGKITQCRITFEGKVQSVNFRETSKTYAELCGVLGKVWNFGGRYVKAVVQGTPLSINAYDIGLRRCFSCTSTRVEEPIEKKFKKYEVTD